MENYFVFGLTPIIAVTGVWGLFKILKFSSPLKDAALDWLTKKDQREAFVLQYEIVRAKLLGSRIISIRRALASIVLIVLWITIFTVCYITKVDAYLFLVAYTYFHFAHDAPFLFIVLNLVTFVALLVIISLFEIILTVVIKRKMPIYTNILCLAISYYVSLICAFFLISVSAYLFVIYNFKGEEMKYSNNVAVDTNHLLSTIIPVITISVQDTVQVMLQPLAFVNTSIMSLLFILTPVDEAFDHLQFVALLRGIIPATAYGAKLALLAMMSLSIMAVAIFNLAYICGLAFIKIELFVREKYRYDQSKIMESPIEYLGRVASALAALIVIALNLIVVAWSHYGLGR
jgi:hypothetical protein